MKQEQFYYIDGFSRYKFTPSGKCISDATGEEMKHAGEVKKPAFRLRTDDKVRKLLYVDDIIAIVKKKVADEKKPEVVKTVRKVKNTNRTKGRKGPRLKYEDAVEIRRLHKIEKQSIDDLALKYDRAENTIKQIIDNKIFPTK